MVAVLNGNDSRFTSRASSGFGAICHRGDMPSPSYKIWLCAGAIRKVTRMYILESERALNIWRSVISNAVSGSSLDLLGKPRFR